MTDLQLQATLFDIQSFSLHDGPGIRTVIFFKGCPLSCKWCSNPEGISRWPQERFFESQCQACGACDHEESAQSARAPESVISNGPCPYGARKTCGFEIGLDALFDRVIKDSPFFGPEGGVTLSGGEPFSQPDFVEALLAKSQQAGISTAVESSLYTPFANVERALPYVDFFMFDIKLVDDEKHTKYCGKSNRLVLKNVKHLVSMAAIPLLPRMPVIPGINDTPDDIDRTVAFMKSVGLKYINLLPYMNLGSAKYEQLGMKYELEPSLQVPQGLMAAVSKRFEESGITVL